MTSAIIFASICCLIGASIVAGEESPIVQIRNGTLEGTFMISRKGREFASFRGIPYAQPPVGELRFEPPKPFGSWSGVRSAKEDGNFCAQRDEFTNYENIVGAEDCLYLNVYTLKVPTNEANADKTNYPVLVWIHGGGWVGGTGNSFMYGPNFLMDKDLVVVSMNYRLGALGFLSTEDLVTPGNQGLKDQSMALKWVHENIAAFGGDPNRVTIFGESAGGAGVHFQMVSPLSRGLFHRAISESGVVLNPWALSRSGAAKNETKRIAKHLGCPTDGSPVMINCLKTKDWVDIINSAGPPEVLGDITNSFRPSIEPDHPGAFITEEPAQSLKDGKIADIPWMVGTNSQEGALFACKIYGQSDQDYVNQLDKNFTEIAPVSLLYGETCPEKDINNVTKSIRQFYVGDKHIDQSTRWNVVDMYTDAYFYIGTDNAIRNHLEALSSPVYYYYFTYRGTFSFSVSYGDPEHEYGVVHGDELLYLFPLHELMFPNSTMSEDDHKITDLILGLWYNFAKTGNPTPEKTAEIPVKWKPVRTENIEYLRIASPTDLRMADKLHPDRVNFWASIPYRGNIKLREDVCYDDKLGCANILMRGT